MTDLDDPLEQLRIAAALRAEADELAQDAADKAREQGHSWNAIGAAAGVEANVAEYRWRRGRGPTPKQRDLTDRNATMLAEYTAGETLAEIARRHDLTRERVRQILVRDAGAEQYEAVMAANKARRLQRKDQ